MINRRTAFARLASRYAQLALEAGTSTTRPERARASSLTPVAPKPKKQRRRDVKLSAAVRQQMHIAELMKLAERRGAIDLALGRLAAGFSPSEITAEITGEGMPNRAPAIIAAYNRATPARLAQRSASAPAPGRSSAPTATAAAIIAAGKKAIRLPR